MERKEPTLDFAAATTLSRRVRLTWGEVRKLAQNEPQEPVLVAPAPASSEPPASTDAPQAAPLHKEQPDAASGTKHSDPSPQEARLSDADLQRIAEILTPRIEQQLRAHLREALDVALANATQRARSDVERSFAPIVQQTVAAELRALRAEMLRTGRS